MKRQSNLSIQRGIAPGIKSYLSGRLHPLPRASINPRPSSDDQQVHQLTQELLDPRTADFQSAGLWWLRLAVLRPRQQRTHRSAQLPNGLQLLARSTTAIQIRSSNLQQTCRRGRPSGRRPAPAPSGARPQGYKALISSNPINNHWADLTQEHTCAQRSTASTYHRHWRHQSTPHWSALRARCANNPNRAAHAARPGDHARAASWAGARALPEAAAEAPSSSSSSRQQLWRLRRRRRQRGRPGGQVSLRQRRGRRGRGQLSELWSIRQLAWALSEGGLEMVWSSGLKLESSTIRTRAIVGRKLCREELSSLGNYYIGARRRRSDALGAFYR